MSKFIAAKVYMRSLHLRSKWILAVAIAGVLPLCAETPRKEQALPGPNQTSAGMKLEDREERLGPFIIAGQSFTVVLHKKNVSGAKDKRLRETLAALEIRDEAGSVLYQKAFPYEAKAEGFRQNLSASARLVAGNNGTGLLIHYTARPASKDRGESWQLFGFRNGKLGLFDKPVIAGPPMGSPFLGTILRGGPGAMPLAVSTEVTELRVWTGYFYAIVPVRVDWRNGKLLPGERCFETAPTGRLQEKGCDLRVEAQRVPGQEEFSFLRVFPRAQENDLGVKHVVVKKDSQIEFLRARAMANWSGDGDEMQIHFPQMWLEVLIDNNDERKGWIHTDEDFAAVGLKYQDSAP